MKKFEIELTKVYKIIIEAENSYLAKEFSQFYTSDIIDLSSKQEREKNNFSIENIDCKINEVFEVIEIKENSCNKNAIENIE